MIMFRVRYDRLNRRLKILDEEVEALLEDGDVYMLAVFDAGNITEIEWIDFRGSAVGEA
jgi:hypothetical protein